MVTLYLFRVERMNRSRKFAFIIIFCYDSKLFQTANSLHKILIHLRAYCSYLLQSHKLKVDPINTIFTSSTYMYIHVLLHKNNASWYESTVYWLINLSIEVSYVAPWLAPPDFVARKWCETFWPLSWNHQKVDIETAIHWQPDVSTIVEGTVM